MNNKDSVEKFNHSSIDELVISKLKKLTQCLTPVRDIALLIGIPEGELRRELANPNSEIYKAYYTTKAEVALEIRRRDIQLAEDGSPSAAEKVTTYLRNMSNDE